MEDCPHHDRPCLIAIRGGRGRGTGRRGRRRGTFVPSPAAAVPVGNWGRKPHRRVGQNNPAWRAPKSTCQAGLNTRSCLSQGLCWPATRERKLHECPGQRSERDEGQLVTEAAFPWAGGRSGPPAAALAVAEADVVVIVSIGRRFGRRYGPPGPPRSCRPRFVLSGVNTHGIRAVAVASTSSVEGTMGADIDFPEPLGWRFSGVAGRSVVGNTISPVSQQDKSRSAQVPNKGGVGCRCSNMYRIVGRVSSTERFCAPAFSAEHAALSAR